MIDNVHQLDASCVSVVFRAFLLIKELMRVKQWHCRLANHSNEPNLMEKPVGQKGTEEIGDDFHYV